MTFHRRDALRIAAAAGATAVTGSVAGCLGSLPFGAPPYAAWLHDPTAVGDGEDYVFTYVEPATVREDRERFDDFLVGIFGSAVEDGLEDTGLELSAVDRVVWPGAGQVYRAEFERARVVGDLTESGYEEVNVADDGTLYADENAGRAVGLLDGAVVTADSDLFSSVDPVEVVSVLLATSAGDRERYPDLDEDVDELVGHLGEGYFVRGGPDDPDEATFDDQQASGIRLALAESRTDVRLVYTFEEERDADAERVADWVRENENSLAFPVDLFEVEGTREGRNVLVDAGAETDDLVDAFGSVGRR